ncbi:MAG: response regulator [Blastocatellia bacterium]|nr:response regulator [Blastocatellia bacterium]
MLAGKKLLLADDSITIQKVVDLTFADEGVTVLAVNNGREAIEKLSEFAPDIVLADVFMPQMSGYEVCEHIKQNDQLKHIPVMLLVGSFEPFDEAEARRVGANDTLTKPFQSIRNLIDKVGVLVGGRAAEEQVPTAELPHHREPAPEPEKLTEEEIQVTTADTLPLPPEQAEVVAYYAAKQEAQAANHSRMDATIETKRPDMAAPQTDDSAGELLLDLSDMKPGTGGIADDFVLDLDLDEPAEPSPAVAAYSAPSFTRREHEADSVSSIRSTATVDPMARTQEFPRRSEQPFEPEQPAEHVAEPEHSIEQMVAYRSEPNAENAQALVSEAGVSTVGTASELSPEMIDAIARRAVEQLSEKVVQEIAWEVVPQLAELMIKRQLEENSS